MKTAAKSTKRNVNVNQKPVGLKALGPNVLPSDLNRKRYYKPKITLEVNPHCMERQLDDQYHLMQLNRNPRANQLTKAELQRSEKFLITKKDPPNLVLDRKKAHILSKSLGVSLQEGWEAVDRYSSPKFTPQASHSLLGGLSPEGTGTWTNEDTTGMCTSHSQDGLQTTSKRRQKNKAKRKVKKDPNTMPELVPYRMTVTDAEPPTYGHRPKSASRMMNPATMGVNVSTAKPESPSRKPRAGMSSELLRELLASSASEGVKNSKNTEAIGLANSMNSSTGGSLDWEYSRDLTDSKLYNETGNSFSYIHSSAEGDLRLNTSIQNRIQDSLAKLELQPNWDNSLTLPSKKGKKPASLILEGSIPVRTEDKLQRYRKRAAGIEFHPFCSDRQTNDLESIRTREGIKKPILKEPAPLTPRKTKQSNEIKRLLDKEKKRQQKLKNIEAKHDLIELWSRIPQH